ncbi:hypothetical protein PC129_g18119 [Phytophthora cactorum]|uniref:Uncharacterized protein n=2 Tax=Phytophthora cactorum TaxID=29920 RepID=A0A329RIR5_9STRA|nr:hypothetical protein Pcac1_g21295 [Phytophthora cactorum]KAG2802814.1 hypothetical protein PC112_g19469 [Phytophthora cactorum]KAG2803508.1 hypothetical protein PC111_g18653 [Phytophthora cactorum]KAG2840067.1 hypothetical protein PC113_g19343 [Phytophthora cactorum]KAG2882103.1 hypothetical protein PC114_g21196 [Phytophthora cactorum]
MLATGTYWRTDKQEVDDDFIVRRLDGVRRVEGERNSLPSLFTPIPSDQAGVAGRSYG